MEMRFRSGSISLIKNDCPIFIKTKEDIINKMENKYVIKYAQEIPSLLIEFEADDVCSIGFIDVIDAVATLLSIVFVAGVRHSSEYKGM